MSGAAPHPSAGSGGAGALLLRLLAGLLAMLAGGCALLLVPFTLLIAATSKPGELAPGIEPWMIYLWCLFAFVTSIGVVIAGIGEMERPRLRRILVLSGLVAAIFVFFPPFVPLPA